MEVLRGAEELIVAVCTIGPTVDEHVRDYQSQKDHFKAMMLDEVASWAVDQVRQGLYQDLEAELQAKGWRASTMLSPGESAWSVDDQRVIFEILNTSSIGVSLTDSCMMIPLKSLSMIMGIGNQPMGVEGLTNCDFCSMQDKCRYYQVRAGVQS
jgi:cobalamin-dependent methionine synthase I